MALITDNCLKITGEKLAYERLLTCVKETYFTSSSPYSKHINNSGFLEDSSYIRTNNFCEGYHRGLAQRIKYQRSRLSYVDEILKMETEHFERKLVE